MEDLRFVKDMNSGLFAATARKLKRREADFRELAHETAYPEDGVDSISGSVDCDNQGVYFEGSIVSRGWVYFRRPRQEDAVKQFHITPVERLFFDEF